LATEAVDFKKPDMLQVIDRIDTLRTWLEIRRQGFIRRELSRV
jgi:hypothetical protein